MPTRDSSPVRRLRPLYLRGQSDTRLDQDKDHNVFAQPQRVLSFLASPRTDNSFVIHGTSKELNQSKQQELTHVKMQYFSQRITKMAKKLNCESYNGNRDSFKLPDINMKDSSTSPMIKEAKHPSELLDTLQKITREILENRQDPFTR
jgi:hypothetical protein